MPRPIGFVGVGIMGGRMCRNLVKGGFQALVHDASPAALAAAGAIGAEVAGDLATLARQVEVVLLSLPTPDIVLSVLEGPDSLLAHLPPSSTVCDLSTGDPGTARKIHAAAQAKAIHALDCPVSGGPTGAEAGTLTIMAGGDPADLARVRRVLETIGTKIVHCGGPGTGQAAKLVNQALVGIQSVAAFEALLVGRKAGLDLNTMFTILQSSSGRSWMLENHLRTQALSGNFEPGFALDWMFKDLKLFVQAAAELEAPAVLSSLALQLYNAARAGGQGRTDQTIVAKILEAMAGVELGKLRAPVGDS